MSYSFHLSILSLGILNAARVSEAFHLCPNLDILIPALREGGLDELDRRCTLTAGQQMNDCENSSSIA